MHKLPMSDFMQDYYEKNGITFTDSERATMIWNAHFSWLKAEILDALKEIADTTVDGTLKAQIVGRLDAERESWQQFQENDGRCLFICIPDADQDAEKDSRCFTTLEAAVAYGREENQGAFTIQKEAFWDKINGSGTDDDTNETDLVGGRAWYTKAGELLDFTCNSFTSEISVSFSYGEPSRFEDAYIPLQSPFEIGDIVRIAGDSRPAIVQVGRKEWEHDLKRNTDGSRTLPPSFDTTCLTVEFLDADGEMYHGHPHLLSLEKIDRWDDELEWDLLQAAGRLIKGGGSLDEFLLYYHQNLKRAKKQIGKG